jgi:hypothetical protein
MAPRRKGFVYLLLLRSGRHYKIGHALDVVRLRGRFPCLLETSVTVWFVAQALPSRSRGSPGGAKYYRYQYRDALVPARAW